jgi:hypothetical protein
MQAPFSRFGVPIEKGGMVLWQVVVFWFHNGVFGNYFVLARQTSDQQPDHRHPYSRFAGLDANSSKFRRGETCLSL